MTDTSPVRFEIDLDQARALLEWAMPEPTPPPVEPIRPIYLVNCGGAPRTEINPLSLRWEGKPGWFMEQAQRAHALGYRRVIWHYPTGWFEGAANRNPQQGSRFLHWMLDGTDFRDAVAWGLLNGMTFGMYLQPEFVAGDGWKYADTGMEFSVIAVEMQVAATLFMSEIWWDHSSNDEGQHRIRAWTPMAKQFGLTLGIEAWRLDFAWPRQMCLDQFITPERWGKWMNRVVPTGVESHLLLHQGDRMAEPLTPAQIDRLRANGHILSVTSSYRGAVPTP